ncbi:unnamed protein product [Alopecurus aequalis]
MPATSSSSFSPLDTDPHTPLQSQPAMPRALPTPHLPDRLNFNGFAENLPMIPTSSAPPALVFPSQTAPPPYSHPILGVHIHDYIKFQVNSSGANFSKWRQIFKFLLTMYKVLDHVTEGAAPRNPDDNWLAVDIHISLWFMATLSDDLYHLLQGPDGLACTTWTRLQRFFLDNQSSRYLFLSKAFRNTPRGDMSIATYASKLQSIADDLDAIGRPVDDRDLTLQFIDGLGDRYKLQEEILKGALPSFADACSRLQLAEVSSDNGNAQAFAVHGADRGQPSNGSGRGGRTSARQHLQRTPAWRSGRARPWPRHVSSWWLFRTHGGALPPAHSPWVPPNAASPVSPYSFDHAAMIHAATSNGQYQPQQPPEWIVDSGASSHITGPSHQETSPSLQ